VRLRGGKKGGLGRTIRLLAKVQEGEGGSCLDAGEGPPLLCEHKENAMKAPVVPGEEKKTLCLALHAGGREEIGGAGRRQGGVKEGHMSPMPQKEVQS